MVIQQQKAPSTEAQKTLLSLTTFFPEKGNVQLGKLFSAEIEAAKKVLFHVNIVRHIGYNTAQGNYTILNQPRV